MPTLAAIDLPAPVNRGERVLDLVMADITETSRIADMIRADLVARAEKGKEKYGQYLMTEDGRPRLWDLYQELLDALMYARKDGETATFRQLWECAVITRLTILMED